MATASQVVEQLGRQNSSHQTHHSFRRKLTVVEVAIASGEKPCRQTDLPMLDIAVEEQLPQQAWMRRVIEWIV